jgi:undecaprenyl-diphosphatase
VASTIPVGLAGLALDKVMREYLGRPIPAAVFLLLNGVVLLAVELLQRRGAREPDTVRLPQLADAPTELIPVDRVGEPVADGSDRSDQDSDVRLSRLPVLAAVAIGATQIFALLPGISRSGVTMAGGLLRGLRHEDAARFAFLLATPVIAGAGLLKLPDLARPELRSSLGPVAAGTLVAGVGAYLSVRFLVRYFRTRTLTPFALYCVLAGLGCLLHLTLS